MKDKIVAILLLFVVVLGFTIRIYKIDNTSLFGDEIDFGYQALSIVETGKDYYGNFLPVYFHSLSEWKTSAFIYAISPFIAVFGVDELGIRLPSIIFGTLSLLFIYLLVNEITGNKIMGIVSALFLAIVPWHIHYSRIGFEASIMFFTYIAGIYYLFKSQINNRLLPLSAFLLAFSFVIYRTQLIFIPITLLVLILCFRKEILSISKKYIFLSVIVFLSISSPYIYQTFIGPGSERFSSLSIFDLQEMNNDVGMLRIEDKKYLNSDILTKVSTMLFHNKYTYFSSVIANNFLKSYSTQFLFITGDPNPRQNVPEMGELYKYQLPFLLIGLLFFIDKKIGKKNKLVVGSWMVFAPLAASLTRDGSTHATRLFMLLIPLSIIFSYGVYYIYTLLKTKFAVKTFLFIFFGFSLLFLINFLHAYFVHYSIANENWWNSGFKEMVTSVVLEKNNFDKIIISSADVPAEIFFAGMSQYPPVQFQKEIYLPKQPLLNFGDCLVLSNKYYFPQVGTGFDLYLLGKVLPNNSLYVASRKEIPLNLIGEPGRIPNDIKLIKTVTLPSGEPIFYLFTKPDNF